MFLFKWTGDRDFYLNVESPAAGDDLKQVVSQQEFTDEQGN